MADRHLGTPLDRAIMLERSVCGASQLGRQPPAKFRTITLQNQAKWVFATYIAVHLLPAIADAVSEKYVQCIIHAQALLVTFVALAVAQKFGAGPQGPPGGAFGGGGCSPTLARMGSFSGSPRRTSTQGRRTVFGTELGGCTIGGSLPPTDTAPPPSRTLFVLVTATAVHSALTATLLAIVHEGGPLCHFVPCIAWVWLLYVRDVVVDEMMEYVAQDALQDALDRTIRRVHSSRQSDVAPLVRDEVDERNEHSPAPSGDRDPPGSPDGSSLAAIVPLTSAPGTPAKRSAPPASVLRSPRSPAASVVPPPPPPLLLPPRPWVVRYRPMLHVAFLAAGVLVAQFVGFSRAPLPRWYATALGITLAVFYAGYYLFGHTGGSAGANGGIGVSDGDTTHRFSKPPRTRRPQHVVPMVNAGQQTGASKPATPAANPLLAPKGWVGDFHAHVHARSSGNVVEASKADVLGEHSRPASSFASADELPISAYHLKSSGNDASGSNFSGPFADQASPGASTVKSSSMDAAMVAGHHHVSTSPADILPFPSRARHRNNKVQPHDPSSASNVKEIKWRKGELLGRGGYGAVHIALNECSGQLMAVKSIPFDARDPQIQSKMAMLATEISVMKSLQHPSIVSYYFAERVGDTMHIFMEYVPGGSLKQVLDQFGPLNDNLSSAYTTQILIGVAYLHSRFVIHRDMKCANVLLTTEGMCKLADFGSACEPVDHFGKEGLNSTPSGLIGTPVWMAPEVLMDQRHETMCDIWSLGCTVMEMLTAKPPWAHLNLPPLVVMQHVIKHDVKLPHGLTKGACEFMMKCLKKQPEARPTAEELLRSRWLTDEDSLMSVEDHCLGSARQPPPSAAGSMSEPAIPPAASASLPSLSETSSMISSAALSFHTTLGGQEGMHFEALMSAMNKVNTLGENENRRKINAAQADLEHRASLIRAPSVRSLVGGQRSEKVKASRAEGPNRTSETSQASDADMDVLDRLNGNEEEDEQRAKVFDFRRVMQTTSPQTGLSGHLAPPNSRPSRDHTRDLDYTSTSSDMYDSEPALAQSDGMSVPTLASPVGGAPLPVPITPGDDILVQRKSFAVTPSEEAVDGRAD